MARISIYVSDEQKAEMDKLEAQANWSSVAQKAFEQEINRLRWPKETKMDQAMSINPVEIARKSIAHHFVTTEQAVRVALDVIAALETAGFRIVSAEATEEMAREATRTIQDFYSEKGPYPRAKAVHRALHAAAPKWGEGK
ncbi:MAG: hypothetical protein ACRDHG_01230 [Anaerolineales bacterium]